MPSLKAMAREAQKRPKTVTSKQPINPKHSLFKSTERIADSDLESETESESSSDSDQAQSKLAMPVTKANGHKIPSESVASHKNGQQSKEAEEDDKDTSEDEGTDEVREDERDVEIDESVGTSDAERISESHSSDESEEGSEGNSTNSIEQETEPMPKTAGFISESTAGQVGPSPPTAAAIYSPPDGFELVTSDEDIKAKVSQIFLPSNLAGKQLWYITAPAAVPIGSVKKVSLDDVRLGKPAFTISNRKYGFVQLQAEERGVTKVLVPDGNSVSYRIGQKAIDQTLHLQQIVDLPALVASHSPQRLGSHGPPQVSQPTTGPARKQPEGLKMRFRPIGFGRGKTGTIGSNSSSNNSSSSVYSDTDKETEDTPPVFQRSPKAKQLENKPARRSREDSSSEEDSEEKTDKQLAAAKKNAFSTGSSTDSVSSVEDSDGEEEPKSLSIPRKAVPPPFQPLKRKLRDAGLDKTPGIITKRSKSNEHVPKTTEFEGSAAARVEQLFGTPNVTQKLRNLPSSSSLAPRSATTMTPIPPPRISSAHLNPSTSANLGKKMTPVPPPQVAQNRPFRQQIVRSSVQSSSQNHTPSLEKLSSPAKPETADGMTIENSEGAAYVNNGTTGRKDRKDEKRRVKENKETTTSQDEPKEFINKISTGLLKSAIDIPLPFGHGRQQISATKPPSRSSLNKDGSQDALPLVPPNLDADVSENKSKKSHARSTKATPIKHNGTIYHTPDRRELISPGPPRKVSVILPPKLTKTSSK